MILSLDATRAELTALVQAYAAQFPALRLVTEIAAISGALEIKLASGQVVRIVPTVKDT